jgi:hypothetical protein
VSFGVLNAGGDVNNFTKQMIVDAIRDGINELIATHEENRFADVDARPNFYGNYEIDYPLSN